MAIRFGGSLVLVGAALAWATGAAHAGDDKPLEEMSLEELLEVEIAVTAPPSKPQRSAPGIITVITREELADLGARDLIDVLELVPGIAFGVDVQGVVGIGMRGCWAHEGKVLLLVDGLPLNEMQYSTTPFGNRFSVAQIERVEVIRGPGSVGYGGYAELGVINIVTRAANGLVGGVLDVRYGQFAGSDRTYRRRDDYARRSLSASWGEQLGPVRVYGRAYAGDGQRSDRDYVDRAGDRYDLERNSALDPFAAALGVDVAGLTARVGGEMYQTSYRDGYDRIWPGALPVEMSFTTGFAQLQYRRPITRRLAITSYAHLLHQRPWHHAQAQIENSELYFATTGTRATGGVRGSYAASQRVELQLGVEGYHEVDVVPAAAPPDHRFPGDALRRSFDDATVYAAGVFATRWVDLTVGGRLEAHDDTGLTAVPRLAATRRAGRFHAKALFAQGFRAPSAQNLRLNPEIEPERTTAIELEAGYRVSAHLIATANVFDLTIDDPIIYGYDPTAMRELYFNETRTGSRGVELVVRGKSGRAHGTIAYSFYTSEGKNEVEDYRVAADDTRLLGLPAHKLTVDGSVRVAPHVHVAPSLMVLGPRIAYVTADGLGEPIQGRLEPEAIVDLAVRVSDVGMPGLDVGLGVFDALDSHMDYAQPYAGGHLPYPAPAREVMVRATFATQ